MKTVTAIEEAPRKTLHILSQGDRDKGRKLFIGNRGQGRREAKQCNAVLLDKILWDPGKKGKVFIIGLDVGYSFVKCCPPEVSYITFDMFNILYTLLEILVQPKINKNNDSQVILRENGQHCP